jgi:hypothetical protein
MSGLSMNISGVEDKVKLVWRVGDAILSPYFVNGEALTTAAQRVRDVLCRISYNYMRDPTPDYFQLLPELVSAGDELNAVLFTVIEGSDRSAEQIKKYLAELPTIDLLEHPHGRTRLTIFSDASVHIPWNFVIRAESSSLPAKKTETIKDFSQFWISALAITSRFNKSELLPLKRRTREDCKVLYALHKERYLAAKKILLPEEQSRFDKLLSYEVKDATTWDRCREKWTGISDSDSILYIFAHSDGQRLFLNNKKENEDGSDFLDAARFLKTFRKKGSTTSATVCFVNGCQTSAGLGRNSFLAVTSGIGFQGFIGTEAEVSNEFAIRYGIEFMDRLYLKGLTVLATMNELLIHLFPQSLLYSCFAHGDFRIEPAESCRGSIHVSQAA